MLEKIIRYTLLLSISSSFITGCSHVAGNIIPNDGPTMESIYDDAGETNAVKNNRDTLPKKPLTLELDSQDTLPSQVNAADFAQLKNPELKLYVFPHLAGTEMLPIPGYWTAFPAYTRSYYALPLENKTIDVERVNS